MIYEMLTLDEPSPYSGRIYPTSEVEAAVERYNVLIEDRSSVGMLGGPFDHFPTEVDLSQASHIVTSMYIKHGIVKATIKVLSTPYGKILQQLLDSNSVRLSPIMIGMVNTVEAEMLVSNISIMVRLLFPTINHHKHHRTIYFRNNHAHKIHNRKNQRILLC